MSAQKHPSYRKYLLIWVWLVLLLLAGTTVNALHLSKGETVALILFVSLIKAGLVCLFYMHLKFEKLVPIWAVAVFPFFLIGLATFLVFIGTAFS